MSDRLRFASHVVVVVVVCDIRLNLLGYYESRLWVDTGRSWCLCRTRHVLIHWPRHGLSGGTLDRDEDVRAGDIR